ncbi:hypothetical protein MKS88_001787 [Plasmodium brasilianum]|uniref:Uncharacterized protein n=1 Tax=Plasmodium brasilianum TaxID=5824 RepID=A0ACB9YBJ3_PLABR|nr:hypothetical protein MKS88_001787 [Plasmodium brasilianum]
MLQKIKLPLFIKISTFILLILCIIDKPLDENCYFHRKLDIRNYRLLGKYKQDKDSTNVCLKEHSSNNKRNQKRDISNNKNDAYIKYKQSIKDLLNKEQYYTEIVDHNSRIPGLYGIKSLNFSWDDIGKKGFWKHFKDIIENMVPMEIRPYIHIITFSILMIITSVILIVVIYKTLRNNEKYKKIKLMRE